MRIGGIFFERVDEDNSKGVCLFCRFRGGAATQKGARKDQGGDQKKRVLGDHSLSSLAGSLVFRGRKSLNP